MWAILSSCGNHLVKPGLKYRGRLQGLLATGKGSISAIEEATVVMPNEAMGFEDVLKKCREISTCSDMVMFPFRGGEELVMRMYAALRTRRRSVAKVAMLMPLFPQKATKGNGKLEQMVNARVSGLAVGGHTEVHRKAM